jgi:vacuolar protein sorting-associated protein 29
LLSLAGVVLGMIQKFREDIPETDVFNVRGFRFGLLHGHQVVPWDDIEGLSMWQRKLDVDVLVYGHDRNIVINEHHGKWYLCPGSATGAFSPLEPEAVPSFLLLDVQEKHIVVYMYKIEGDKVRISKKKMNMATKKEE